jgi:beta-glucosidase
MMKKKIRTYSGTTNPHITEREVRNRRIARIAATEGMVLLKNENHFLPFEKGKKLALFGGGAVKTIKGGTGSGDVNERESVTIVQGLEQAGFEITSKGWLEDYVSEYDNARLNWRDAIFEKANGATDMAFFDAYSTTPFEVPGGRDITLEDVAKAGTDTAVYVISRVAGEGADRSAKQGDYYLTDQEEKNLQFVCEHFAHVLLILNAGAQVDLSCLKRYPQIQGVLYMVQAGMEGGNALADILTGDVTPSGKLTDTWAVNYEDYPASAHFSHNDGDLDKQYYEEGIYVGYRYFDSFGIRPAYAFGYGLSYTDFSVAPAETVLAADENRQEISVSLNVTNIGEKYAGKEVAQIYVSCPQEGLDKEQKRLCGFAKTDLLNPGESQQLTITFPAKALASFDEAAGAWVVQEGLYGIWGGNSSDRLQLYGAIRVAETTVVEATERICPLKENLNEKKRPDEMAKTFQENWHRQMEEDGLPQITFTVKEEKLPVYPANEAEGLAADLAEKLTEEEMIPMVIGEISKGQSASENALGSAGIMVPGAAGETSSALEEKYGIPGMPMADGPAGLRLTKQYQVSNEDGTVYAGNFLNALEGGFFSTPVEHENATTYYQYCTAIPVGALLAQTWNPALIQEVGKAVGEEMQEFGVTWWLAPGMNTHRDPLCGRNFEYYSEDPMVSGVIAAAMTNGIQTGAGIGTTIKHYACNNQEDNRMGADSILSERALREIYLKGFEIAVKTSQPMAVMTSYNLVNGVHSANNYDLCTQVLRKEWGFKGIVMTDWTTTSAGGGSTAWKCITAGNDLIMPGSPEDVESITNALMYGSLPVEDLRACVRRLLTIAYQSNCFEDAKSYKAQFENA